jgi:16S rRNA (cytidine1402-2'-O)-methyltransferase
MPGQLLVAATPLGNAADASSRLVDALATADVVAAEDTRRLRSLAAALGVSIKGRIVSHYDAVEASRVPALTAAIEAGKTVLMITDAGMPSVSDPGYRLITACVDAGLPVTCLPGPSALTTALVLSGLPTDRFCFEGFAPRRAGDRRRWLDTLRQEPRTVVFFEAPHRLAACLVDAAAALGADRPAAVCRELTKRHEEVRRGTLAELARWAADEQVRGEITVVLGGTRAPAAGVAMDDLLSAVQTRVAGGERFKDVVAAVAADAGVSRRELYEAALERRRQQTDFTG